MLDYEGFTMNRGFLLSSKFSHTKKSQNKFVDWLANQVIVRESSLELIKINNVIKEVKGLKFPLASLMMEFLEM